MNRSGVIYKQGVIMYNDFCIQKQCKHYRTWTHQFADCISCDQVGDSYDITIYPVACPFLTEIEIYEQEQEKRILWEKLSAV